MNAIDTNVLVYFVDDHDPAKQAKATELLERLAEEETETAVLWQVAVEFLSCLRRWENEGRIARATTIGHVERLENTFPCITPSRSLLGVSLDLSSRYSLSHWDSLRTASRASGSKERSSNGSMSGDKQGCSSRTKPGCGLGSRNTCSRSPT